MKKLKIAYYYFYYQIYRFTKAINEIFGGSFWTDFKTMLIIDVLEIWLGISILCYYNIFVDMSFSPSKTTFIVVALMIGAFNTYFFDWNDQWKHYNKKFDKLPYKTKKRGAGYVLLLIIFIVLNFIISLHLKLNH